MQPANLVTTAQQFQRMSSLMTKLLGMLFGMFGRDATLLECFGMESLSLSSKGSGIACKQSTRCRQTKIKTLWRPDNQKQNWAQIIPDAFYRKHPH